LSDSILRRLTMSTAESASSSFSLSPADLHAVLDALGELYTLHDLEAFPQVSLRILRKLIPSIFTSYNELNLRTGAVVVVFEPVEARDRCFPYLPKIARLGHEHPLLTDYQNSGEPRPQAISDFVGWEEWRQREIFREAFGPLGIGESLSFIVQSTTLTQIFFVLNRALPDFTPRDRAICELLRPHLAQAFDNAQAFTETRAIAALATGALAELSHGVLIADLTGHLRHGNDLAIELLDRYFPAPAQQPRRLPPAVTTWLEEQQAGDLRPHHPLRVEQENRTLVIRFARREEGYLLLLSERGAEPDARRLEKFGLSPREAEVLYWVTQGKSNSQVAAILNISPRTVDKHLENIFGKLGVDARGPAMCLAAGALGGQG
jgi:DNA-binding CsgD family transcriptional regulator